MEQLLHITNVPIKIEVVVKRARMDYDNKAPKVEVTREKGGLRLEAKPIKINIDSTAIFDKIGLKGPATISKDFAEKGMKVLYDATVKIVENGDKLLDAKHFTPADLVSKQWMRSMNSMFEFLPGATPDITWKDGTLNVQYTADNLEFDWETNPNHQFEFIPGSIQFNIKEMPHVEIEYVGGPIYVPASSDPDYVEPKLFTKI